MVKELFRVHVFSSKTNMFLNVNPTIVNEITHLARDPLKKYLNAHPQLVGQLTRQDAATLERTIVGNVKQLIENGILLVLDGDESSVLKQLDLYNQLGAADAVNASIANLFGASLLTVDSKLANNMKDLELELPNLQNIYYTTGRYRDYR